MQLAHDSLGQGPQLVLLHPLGADRRVWDPVLERLAPHREVVAIDMPGFGASPPLRETPTPGALAGAVASFLQTAGIDRPCVVGNSLGGWVTLELALSGHARSAAAIGPAGLWPEPLMPKRNTARTLARLSLPLVNRIASSPGGRRLLLAGTVARPDQVPADAAAHLVRSYATAPGLTAANDAMRAGRFVGLERIRVPVTLIWPEHDRLVGKPSWLPPNVKSLALSGCGHIPMWDDPDAVARLILASTDASENSASGPKRRSNPADDAGTLAPGVVTPEDEAASQGGSGAPASGRQAGEPASRRPSDGQKLR